MATPVEPEEDNSDYESDPEVIKMSLNMRRRQASDDESDDEADTVEPRSGDVTVASDDNDEGAAAVDDDYYEEDEVYYDEEEEDDVAVVEVQVVDDVEERGTGGGGEVEENVKDDVVETEADRKVEGEEKKEVEPFAVPTSGAFYMHDDRFRGKVDDGQSRTFGGRKLWESKDERKWGHDKFEELNGQERKHYEEGRRSSRGSYRVRGRPRGAGNGHGHGHGRGSRVSGANGNINQNAMMKDVRGRGSRRYQAVMKNKSEIQPVKYKQSARSFDKSSRTDSGRTAASVGSSYVEHEVAPAKKVGSNLSSASPPFYPSGGSTKDIASTQKREMNAGNYSRNVRPSMDPSVPIPASNLQYREKNTIDRFDKLQIDDTVSPDRTKAMNNLQSSTSSSFSPNQFAHPRGHGRAVAPSRAAVFRPIKTNNQDKVSAQVAQANQQSPIQIQPQPAFQVSGQHPGQRAFVAAQSSSPPKAAGKGADLETGRGSVVYGGAHALSSGGNVGAGHGDSNMPSFFPVMQFGGQHPGGMGVPAVGMAFPGYVAQPNGLGSSEMAWLPMLASAAGALGASYCPPYLAGDGTYHPRPTGQTSALTAPSKDNHLSIPDNEIKSLKRLEVSNDDFSHRQNKPSRRYSEMNFSN